MEASTESPYSFIEAPDSNIFSRHSRAFVYRILRKIKLPRVILDLNLTVPSFAKFLKVIERIGLRQQV